MKNRNAKLKKSVALAAIVAIIISVISLTAISSEELKGALRGKTNSKGGATTSSSSTTPTPTGTPSAQVQTNPSGTNSGSPSATLEAYGYNFPGNSTIHPKRGYNADCKYWTEIGKWKLTVNNAPLRLLRLPLYVRSLSGNANYGYADHVATQYRLYFSRTPNNAAPLATYTATSTNNFFMFDLQAQNSAGAGVLLQPGANYIILEAFIDPQQGAISSSPDAQSNVQTLISESANINNQIQTLNGTWGNFEGTNGAALQKGVNLTANAIDTAMIVTLVGKYSNQLCGAVNPGAGGTIGNVGVANLPPDTMNVNSLPDLHVSAACPQINTWEILGNWKLQLSGNDLKLKQLKFNVWRGNSSGPSPTENGAVSNEYRVFVSTDPVNYSGTAVASGTISNINTINFTIPLQNGGALLGQNWINTTGDVYYVTLEGKPFENTTYNETAQPIRSYINLDPAFSWGTFGEGKPWAHEATGNNSAIQSSSLAASVQGQGTLLWGGGRTLNQIDAEHPVASCVGLSDPATDLTFTQNIKEVQISACNNTNTDWVAVFQGTIETGYQSLALDGIPTVIREVGNTGLGGDEVAMVKLIISNTADYAASEVASYEMDPASSWFLLATPGLTLQPQTTYYTTYLVRPNPNLAYTPGPNRKVQVGWMGNAFAITKLGNAVVGHFSPSTTNLDARLENPGMNITISPNPSYQAPNQSGKFWFTPCAN